MSGAVIDCQTLSRLLDEENAMLFITTLSDPATGEEEAFPEQLIPNSQWFDYEKVICDLTSDLPHTMPNREHFETCLQELGVNQDSTLVFYDNKGIYSSARAWWMCKTMGLDNVYVLDGGLPLWLSHQLPTVQRLIKRPNRGNFIASFDEHRMASKQAVLDALGSLNTLIVDARSAARFHAQVPEPREWLRSGHIPGSANVPFASLIDEQGCLDLKIAKSTFDAIVSDKHESMIFSCGSGVTACILALAAFELGYSELAVYDGSWSEWGADASLPISSV